MSLSIVHANLFRIIVKTHPVRLSDVQILIAPVSLPGGLHPQCISFSCRATEKATL